MAAALVRRERVDLVDDDGARGREHRATGFRAEQDVERLRRRHDDVRRPPSHAGTLRLRGVARAHQRADVDVGEAERRELRADARERRFEVLLDVVGERLQRRDVDDVRFVGQRGLDALAHQRIDRGEERGERLARAGGRCDEHVPPGLDQRPGARLGLGGFGKMLAEPGFDGGMKERVSRHAEAVRRSELLRYRISGKVQWGVVAMKPR